MGHASIPWSPSHLTMAQVLSVLAVPSELGLTYSTELGLIFLFGQAVRIG